MLRKAFTLMEVNLAILIMAGGVLAVVSLFSLGYRENRQSREDVASATYADAVLSPLVMACSATNLTWIDFQSIKSTPSGGWGGYVNHDTGLVEGDPETHAKTAWDAIMSKVGSKANVNTAWPTTAKGMPKAGLVVTHEDNSAVVKIAFRASRNRNELLAMPLYYTEVRFQGVTDKANESEE